jgi:two-component system response regulator HydG
VGSSRPNPIDIRLICATNLSLVDLVNKNQFRQDLLYRINTVEIKLPPLRDRKEDIPVLAEHFKQRYARKYQKHLKKLPSDTIKKLQAYHWPGNIRELEHAIERAIILSESATLRSSDFVFTPTESPGIGDSNEATNLDQAEKKIIEKILKKNSGNLSRAARELGISRAALYRRIEKHRL